jgi:hypothetical protein
VGEQQRCDLQRECASFSVPDPGCVWPASQPFFLNKVQMPMVYSIVIMDPALRESVLLYLWIVLCFIFLGLFLVFLRTSLTGSVGFWVVIIHDDRSKGATKTRVTTKT